MREKRCLHFPLTFRPPICSLSHSCPSCPVLCFHWIWSFYSSPVSRRSASWTGGQSNRWGATLNAVP